MNGIARTPAGRWKVIWNDQIVCYKRTRAEARAALKWLKTQAQPAYDCNPFYRWAEMTMLRDTVRPTGRVKK